MMSRSQPNPTPETALCRNALVVGAGPAGLMATEMLAREGAKVTLVDQMPSVGRKFLMAGKSGLNLTKETSDEAFLAAYGPQADWLRPMLEVFGPSDVMAWAEGLGQELFTGSTGRVFPKVMKASPLLRAWLARLDDLGVELQTRWRWTGWAESGLRFETPDGVRGVTAGATVLALGGASWARLGSDGTWAKWIGVETEAFQPANMGLEVAWSPHMTRHFGRPVKGVCLSAGGQKSRGEVVLSAGGIEGGGIYPLAPELRQGAALLMDLCPDLSLGELAARLARVPAKASMATRLRKGAALSPEKQALAQEFGRPLPADPQALAGLLKALRITHQGPRPLDEAISVAGGVSRKAVDARLMLRQRPGVFACGEMLDWEAPTGGYLLTACLSTGRWAGQAAAAWLAETQPRAR